MSKNDADGWMDVAAFMELADLGPGGQFGDDEDVSALELDGLTVRSFDDLFELSEE